MVDYEDLKPMPGEGLYVDFEPEFDLWGVFGDRSGFCYFLAESKEEAAQQIPEGRAFLVEKPKFRAFSCT